MVNFAMSLVHVQPVALHAFGGRTKVVAGFWPEALQALTDGEESDGEVIDLDSHHCLGCSEMKTGCIIHVRAPFRSVYVVDLFQVARDAGGLNGVVTGLTN